MINVISNKEKSKEYVDYLLESKVNFEQYYVRPYELVAANLLDLILLFGKNGVTHEKLSELSGYRGSIVRKTLANLINRVECKTYICRKLINNYFVYFPVFNYDSYIVYKKITGSAKKKETIAQTGLKNSIYKDQLIDDCQLFPNVMLRLKRSKSNWKTVSELAKELGVDNDKGRKSIYGELNRDLKCPIAFIEKQKIGNNMKYRLIYKYRKHTIEELKQISKTFPRPEDKIEVRSSKTEIKNNMRL